MISAVFGHLGPFFGNLDMLKVPVSDLKNSENLDLVKNLFKHA